MKVSIKPIPHKNELGLDGCMLPPTRIVRQAVRAPPAGCGMDQGSR